MLDGVGEEESLVATGGAADHLAVVYNTDDQVTFFMMINDHGVMMTTGGAAGHLADDQVTFFMMIMAWRDDGLLGCC